MEDGTYILWPMSIREDADGDAAAEVRFNDRFLDRFIELVPLAHALERCLECELLAAQPFVHPVLDLGCGDGTFAKVLFAQPIELGLDPDQRELDLAQATGAYRRLVRASGDSIPEPDGSFGTVFSNSVLEHIRDLPPVLKEINRVLSSDGRLYVTVPTDVIERVNLGRVILRWFGPRVEGSFQRTFRRVWRLHNVHPPQVWAQLFADAGFAVEESVRYQSLRMYRTREVALPFSLPAWVLKRTRNRWLISPVWFRRFLIAPVARALRRFGEPITGARAGGLLLLGLRKIQ